MAELNLEKLSQELYERVKKRFIEEGGIYPVWHNMKTDPPKEADEYLVCRYSRWHPKGEVMTSNYSLNLEHFGIEKGGLGWWFYDDEWGYVEDGPFDYWMPMPKPPKKEEDACIIDITELRGE